MSIFISILLSFINLFITIDIIANSKGGKIFDSLVEFICRLFRNRNIFGIFFSLIACSFISPAFTLVANIAIINWIYNLCKHTVVNLPSVYKLFCDIWEIGNKKSK